METWKPRTNISSESIILLDAILADPTLLRVPEKHEFRVALQKAVHRKTPWDPTIRETIDQIGGTKLFQSVTQEYILPYRISDFRIRKLNHRKVLTWLREISLLKKSVDPNTPKSRNKVLLSKTEVNKARAALLATLKYAAEKGVPTRGNWTELPEYPPTDPRLS